MNGDTKYFGIYIHKNGDHFFLCEERYGSDCYIGTTAPTEQQIDEYRNNLIKGGF